MPDCTELGRELVAAWKECDRLRGLLLKASTEIERLEDALREEGEYWSERCE